jgi:hypothetical protein
MIVQVALRNGPESEKVASLQRILKASGHGDPFKGLPRPVSYPRYVLRCPQVADPDGRTGASQPAHWASANRRRNKTPALPLERSETVVPIDLRRRENEPHAGHPITREFQNYGHTAFRRPRRDNTSAGRCDGRSKRILAITQRRAADDAPASDAFYNVGVIKYENDNSAVEFVLNISLTVGGNFSARDGARTFLDELKERMCKFELALHPDKTRLIRFGRAAP